MLNRQQLSLLLLTLAAPGPLVFAGDSYLYQESYGNDVPANADDYTKNLVKSADEHPNATRSINFKPFESFSQKNDPGNLRDIEWTWRVNVTDFSAPNAVAEVSTAGGYKETTFVDPHVVSTVYDFTWPGGGSLNSTLKLSTDAFCITNFAIFGMPANVSNAYKESSSTDCVPVLGAECVNAITGDIDWLSDTKSCYSSPKSGFTLPECASTLGYAFSQNPKHNGITTTSSLSSSLLSSEVIWGAITEASNGTNSSNYEAAVNQLQIMMISSVINQTKTTPQMLCMRVNTSQLDTGGNASQGTGNNTSQGNGGKSTGSSLKYQLRAGVAVVIGWILVVIAYSM